MQNSLSQDLPSNKKGLKTTFWVLLFLGFLFVFTLLKFPTLKIETWIQNQINATLSRQGIYLTQESMDLSFIFGPTLTLEKAQIELPGSARAIHLEKVKIKPSIFSYLIGRQAARIQLWMKSGQIDLNFSMKETQFSISSDMDEVDIGEMGLLQAYANLDLAGILDGSIDLTGDTSDLTTLEGDAKIEIKKLKTKAQTYFGFQLPELSVSHALVEFKAQDKKMNIQKIEIGKKGTPDDIIATVSGDVTLGKSLQTSQLNLKTIFQFSQKITQAFVLIDTLLGPGKQSDGTYSYLLSGTFGSPSPTPVKAP